MRGSRWERHELLAVFALYCRTPFGLLHANNPEIVALAMLLNRSAAAVAMKACNFAALDPVQRERGVRGLANTSEADRRLWQAFEDEPTRIAYESEEALVEAGYRPSGVGHTARQVEAEQTESTAERQVRLIQSFFRYAVLASYDGLCAVCEIPVVTLLNASHIIPWSVDVRRRGDPRNGLSLCTLHDRAFDRGLMTIDEDLRAVVSDDLRSGAELPIMVVAFEQAHGRAIHLPHRFAPAADALAYHREHVFGP